MIAIMISDKPKWCAKTMNGDKLIEVRKNKALASAIQKLIDEYSYADIYVNCTKDKKDFLVNADLIRPPFPHPRTYMLGHKDYSLNGKVVFKFRCYNVEEIDYTYLVNARSYSIRSCLTASHFSKECCLEQWELDQYLKGNKGYAIHILQLEIFDKPKELNEFYKIGHYEDFNDYFTDEKRINGKWCIPLKKAPQNFCYVEVEE